MVTDIMDTKKRLGMEAITSWLWAAEVRASVSKSEVPSRFNSIESY
ncbi:hypothetical protein C7S13_6067 [Burkholderia cepacia]|nr:hypothetical protein [Burkholderia cepacia]